MKRSLLFGGLAVGGAVGVLAACQAIDGIHVYEYTPEASVIIVPGEAGGPVDGSVIIVKEDASVCNRAAEPARPAADAAGVSDTTRNEYILALSLFSFTGNGPVALGYDLDFVCTGEMGVRGPPGPSSCLVPDGGMIQDDITSASGDGVDAVLSNASGALSQIFNDTLDNAASTEANIAQGNQTLLLVIDDYNGLANDPQVSVSTFASEWVQAVGCAMPDTNATRVKHPLPQADGCDVWSLKAVVPGVPPSTGDAYVVNGTLVADFLVGLPFEIGAVSFVPNYPHIVANLEFVAADAGSDAGGPVNPDAGAAGILRINDGLFQGSIGAGGFLRSLGYIHDPGVSDGGGLCPGDVLYDDVLRPGICSSLDINGSGVFDGTQNCDSFTFAASFSAVSAHKGTEVFPNPPVYVCPGGNPDAAGVVDCPLALP